MESVDERNGGGDYNERGVRRLIFMLGGDGWYMRGMWNKGFEISKMMLKVEKRDRDTNFWDWK